MTLDPVIIHGHSAGRGAAGGERTVRVAAAQCGIGTDVAANMDTLVSMVDLAAAEGAQLVVLPEFGNHMSIYDSAEHAWDVAVDTDDPDDAFVVAIAGTARRHSVYVVANATVRRGRPTGGEPPRITVTQMLFSSDGELTGYADKQVLMGVERTYLVGGDAVSEVIPTPLGRIGLYCGMDGVINEPARSLAVRGAEIMCCSLNSFALDEASLHVPARAVESGVWVVACCKVGPLLPEDRRAEFAALVDLPESVFMGGGESQVVSPSGEVLVRAPRSGEAVVVADIDVGRVATHRRPDGSDLLGLRRPAVYAPVAQNVAPLPCTAQSSVDVAAVQAGCGDIAALAASVLGLAADGVDLVVLPELAVVTDGVLEGDPADAVAASDALVAALVRALHGTDTLAVVSVVEADHLDSDAGAGEGATAYSHVGLVVSAQGVLSHQPALHAPLRHQPWQSVMGDRQKVLTTGFGRLSVLVGDDALVPEVGRVATLGGAEVVAVPMSVASSTDVSLLLAARCAENRVCVVAASRPGPAGASAAFDPPADPVWSRPDRVERFDGSINDPDRYVADVEDAVQRVTLHPSRTAEKDISIGTDLVFGRRPELLSALVESQ